MNKYLIHFKGSQEFIERLLDVRNRVTKTKKSVLLPFLNPYEQKIVSSVINDSDLSCSFFGGVENAEMQRALIKAVDQEEDFEIMVFEIKYNTKYFELKHSNVLGALTNIGLKRNQFGDIIIKDKRIFCCVNSQVFDYIQTALVQIDRAKVEVVACHEKIEFEKEYLEKQIIVSSLRLDSICSALTRLSRNKATILIKQKEVKVNHLIIEDISFMCHNNDTVSIRRYGRFVIDRIQAQTKKGNFIVIIKYFK